MSVYNHRPMVPSPVNRFVEMLDSIRNEFDQLTQEAFICKSQRDEFEHKMNSQIQEMSTFQQNLLELERTQQNLKKQYEEEISRLRQQLEQVQSRSSSSHPPMAPMSSSPANLGHPSSHPPPNIGPGSNYFDGIMNAQAYSSYVPPQQKTGTPVAQSAPLPTKDIKRKPGPPPYPPQNPQVMAPGGRPGLSSKSPTVNHAVGTLADIDPESVPANMKVEGQDWFALFNPKTPRYLTVDLVHTLEHSSVVCCVKFSHDGRYMATGCNRATFIYDVNTAQRISVLQDDNVSKDGDLYIRSVCFSPDGKYLATGAEDKQIRIWDIAQRRIRFKLTGHEQDIYSLDFSRDGRIVVSGSGDRTARIWDMADGSLLHTLVIKDNDQKDPGVTSVAISPDSRLVAAGSLDKMVRVWDAYDGKLLEQLEGHKDSVYSVAFMPDGHTLLSGSLDKTLKLWQLGGGKAGYGGDRTRNQCKMTFVGHKDFVLSVACTPDGNWVVSGSKDRGVQFWDPRTGQTQFMLQGHKNSVISVAVSPNGRPLFATGSGDSRARIWSYDPLP
ncbi:WD40-repeat-containing domain protein [Chlamydoabsidia padenii]|nr:WD40-repeat-containing domain protein [Chlamydoabsidia padenii]